MSELLWFDPETMMHVGRPQLESTAGDRSPASDRPTVLYAPTWEGAQTSMAYSSVLTHGVALVRSLLAADLRVVYRPHPRIGANRRDVAVADRAVRELFAGPDAARSDSAVVTDIPLPQAFADADALITDVSSLAVEWLPTGRPLIVTTPADPGALVPSSPLLDAVPRLRAVDADGAGALVRDRLQGDSERGARADLVEYYLGGAAEGSALSRFLSAADRVLASRDEAVAGLAAAKR
jgi:CDP-glycerol glycerophosphotransferase (TagB/SpsB family)